MYFPTHFPTYFPHVSSFSHVLWRSLAVSLGIMDPLGHRWCVVRTRAVDLSRCWTGEVLRWRGTVGRWDTGDHRCPQNPVEKRWKHVGNTPVLTMGRRRWWFLWSFDMEFFMCAWWDNYNFFICYPIIFCVFIVFSDWTIQWMNIGSTF